MANKPSSWVEAGTGCMERLVWALLHQRVLQPCSVCAIGNQCRPQSACRQHMSGYCVAGSIYRAAVFSQAPVHVLLMVSVTDCACRQHMLTCM
jgi:hypothetical protein